jgi:hypothetical protein
MRRLKRFFFLLICVAVAASAVWDYRVRAAEEAYEYAPTSLAPVLVPAGTAIHAVLFNGLVENTHDGDSITAFVSDPVAVHGTFVVAPGAQLRGRVEDVSTHGDTATVRMKFSIIEIRGRTFPIQTGPVIAAMPVQDDIDVFGVALRALMSATVASGIGAHSGDRRVIARGMLEGARFSASLPSIPITAILQRDAIVER